jgi:hypothetical protein
MPDAVAKASAGPPAPALRMAVENRTLCLAASGRWTVQEFARLDGEIKTLNVAASKKDFVEARIDLAAIEDLDTAGSRTALAYPDISIPVYIGRLHDAINVRHFLVGMVKAPLIALIIGLVGCLEGLSVQGSAESLGAHVTNSHCSPCSFPPAAIDHEALRHGRPDHRTRPSQW